MGKQRRFRALQRLESVLAQPLMIMTGRFQGVQSLESVLAQPLMVTTAGAQAHRHALLVTQPVWGRHIVRIGMNFLIEN